MPQDKINAYKVLHHALVTVAKLAAPFVPFVTEMIYQNLVVGLDSTAPKSIHLTDFPALADESYPSPYSHPRFIVSDMNLTISTVIHGRAARNIANVKTRQPLPEILVAQSEGYIYSKEGASEKFENIILEELNVKALRYINPSDASEYSSYNLKPQLRTLGKRYGKILPKISEALKESPDEIMATLKVGSWKTTIEGVEIELQLEDVIVETVKKEGFATSSDKIMTVILDTRLTPELIEEGNIRELFSKWQNMRREAGYEVTDRINAGYTTFTTDSTLPDAIERNKSSISGDLLADSISASPPPEGAYIKKWDINGEEIELWVNRQ